MSALTNFNSAINRTQDSRRDVRNVISHVLRSTHECPLLLHGYCRTCPAYIAFRNNQYLVVQQANIPFNYEQEYLSANITARTMLRPAAHIPRPSQPPFSRTRYGDIHPPVDTSTHTCAPCTRQHLDQHTCAPCTEPHLRDHVCAVIPTAPDIPDIPENETETDSNRGDPPLPPNVWRALRNFITQSRNAPNGTPLFGFRSAMTEAQLTPAQVIAAIRPTNTTVTNTVYVPTICTRPHAEDAPPTVCTRLHAEDAPRCQLEHVQAPNPLLPSPPRGVSLDPTVPQALMSVSSAILSQPQPMVTHYGNHITINVVRVLLTSLVNRDRDDHQVNDGPDRASLHLTLALRWSAMMHRMDELVTLPHAEPCMYHPCLISYFQAYVRTNNIPEDHFVHHEPLLRSFLSEYRQHLETHSYPVTFVTEVLTPLEIRGRYPNVQDDSRPYTGPRSSNTIIASQFTHSVRLPRLRFDYDNQYVPATDQDVTLPLRLDP
jgi:hypothetical protein